ncbi:MAG TPA: hypothetical protein VIC82_10305 [Candidatus Nanopelagicales bacterium]
MSRGGLSDTLILPSVPRHYVAERCAAEQPVEYLTYPGRDHLGLVAAASPLIPDLIAWTKARFEGDAAASNCSTVGTPYA